MNKRIKKKKAKQAILREQERLAQELAHLSPEELEDLVRAIRKGLKNIFRALASCFDDLATFFKSFDEP
jgi:hypothetical protein